MSPFSMRAQEEPPGDLEGPIEQPSSTSIIELDVHTTGVSIEEINAPNGDLYHQLGIDEGGVLGEAGYPSLPFKTLKVLLPHGKDMVDIDVQCGFEQVIEGSYNIIPAQELIPIGSGIITDFIFDSPIYNSLDPYPEKLYSVVGTYGLRGYKILVLNVFPVRYIPQIGMVSYFENMKVSISVADTDDENTLYRGLEEDEKMVLDIIDNTEAIDSYKNDLPLDNFLIEPLALPSASYDYVIITNEALKNSAGTYTFQDLADLKNSKGIKTAIVTTEEIYANYSGDDNQTKIRNFIIDAYQNWGIEYVLLGGDGDVQNMGGESEAPIIPTRCLYADYEQIPSDLYYAALDGDWDDNGNGFWGELGEDDLFAEVYIGRAPVDSEWELTNFINKTIAHEEADDPYLAEALMVGEDLGWTVWGGDYKDEVMNGSSEWDYITKGFPSSYNVSTLYDRDLYPSSWGTSDITTILNSNNVHVINHLGHSNVNYNMKMYNPDVDGLTNYNYFFVYSQGCYNGAFDNRGTSTYYDYDSIAEHFVTTSSGAFACIGNSRYGWGSLYDTNGPSQHYDREFFDAIFGEKIMEIGKANQDSKEDSIGFISQPRMRWCYYEINLFGDPTAAIPAEPNNFAPTLSSESVSPTTGYQDTEITFSVTYTDADDNEPSYVSVVINGTEFFMNKVNPSDTIYTDGCDYEYLIYLQSSAYNYSYYFKTGDGEYFVSTDVSDNIEIFYSNAEAPILTGGQVYPQNGYCNATSFEFSVIYSDPDNNEPENIFLSINSTSYPMTKQDPLDTNYMDGSVFVCSTMLEDIGLYSYEFTCSDGIFPGYSGPYSGPYAEEGMLFTGMYMNYTYSATQAGVTSPAMPITISYAHHHDTLFEEKQFVPEYPGQQEQVYLVDMATRRMFNIPGVPPELIMHTPYWIFPNVSIDDYVLIMTPPGGDMVCVVTEEVMCNMPGLGLIEVLVLQDPRFEDAYLWYERSSGILLNGTISFFFYGQFLSIHYGFNCTNAKVIQYQDLSPNADFTASEMSIREGNSVQFTFAGSEGNEPATFLWDFGDGNNSTETNPEHIYDTPGTYDVTLTIRDRDGDLDVEVKNNYIIVVADSTPNIDFFANATIISEGDMVEFTFMGSEGDGPATYEWDFGDGTNSTDQNPIHQYDVSGIYSVSLVVIDSDGDFDYEIKAGYIIVGDNSVPIADFMANGTIVNVNDTVQFTYNGSDGDGLTYYEWDFGDGSELSHIRNPTHIYDTPGIYSVFLLVRDVNGDISYILRTSIIIVKDPSNPGIPGYDVFILFGVVATISIVLSIRHKKNSKIKS